MDELNFLDIFKETGLDITSYQYWHQLLHNRTVIFNSEIDEDIVERIYLPLRDFENDNSNEPVTLILNSPGGSVSDGFFLANYLTQYKKPLHIYVLGYAASMAAVILAAGGKNPNITRYCYPATYALFHDGYVALSTSEAKTASDIMMFNDKIDAEICKFIINNTNVTEEEYNQHSRKQWFIDSKEMLTLNLIDKIIGEDDNEK